ncbi:MAG: BatD family protein [bacterium]|nr:BatD family protein [bacterium]
MMRRSFWIIVLVSFIAICQNAIAQSISAQVSAKHVQVGVPFEYAVVITGASSNYNQPNFKDFDLVSGPMQSNSVQYVNGVMSQQLVFSYGLVARKEGRFVIGAANVLISGHRMETQAVTIDVVKGAAPQGQQGAGEEEKQNSKVSGGDIFIKTKVSKNKIYLGEQITIIQKVYSRYQIIGYQKSVQPSYDGFYSQAQESPTKGQLVLENIDGVQYYTHEVLRTLATANKSGRITLTPIEAEVIVRRQTASKPRNIFEQFFGAAGYEDLPVNAASKLLYIDVLPLPEEGKPQSFNGAVGVFSCKVELSKSEVKANDALNLKMTVTGKGNMKLLSPPKLNLPDVFESYEPKTTEGPSSKTFDFLIIPRHEGAYSLKELDFSYFNLETKKYVVLPSPELKINVLPADPNSTGAQVYSSHSQIKETENDIRYIKKGEFLLAKTETEFFNSITHALLLIIPFILLAGGLVGRHMHIKNNSDVVSVRERKAAKIAKKQLVNAEKLMIANKKDEFYTEILAALTNYLSHKFNIPVADLSRDKINRVMENKQVDAAVITKLMATISTGEYAKYAPGAVSGDLNAVYKDTVELLVGIEQQLNRKVS